MANKLFLVVGGGLTGLSCAQRLREAGKKVLLLEKDVCGAGASGKSSGFVTPDSEIELSSLIKQYGPQKAHRLWDFVLSGVELIRQNIEEHRLDCDYHVEDALFVANSKRGLNFVKKEHAALESLGFGGRLYEAENLGTILGSSGYFGAARYAGTFGMDSALYCRALRDHLIQKGVEIREHTDVTELCEDGVMTASGKIEAEQVILCTDRFIPELASFKKEIFHVQTFLGVSKPLSKKHLQQIFPKERMMVWDTDLIYHYFRVMGGDRLLLGGGDLLYTYAGGESLPLQRFERKLKAYFHQKFPNIPLEIEEIRPGMLGVSKDLLPVMGYDPQFKNVWCVGAATGLSWAAALGAYAADKILSGRDEFDEDFSWNRSFTIGPKLQSLISTPVTYALSHAMTKV